MRKPAILILSVLAAMYLVRVWQIDDVAMVALGYPPAPDCTRFQAAAGIYRRLRYTDAEKRLQKTTREVQEDSSGYRLMETPRGRFWEPRGNGSEVIAELAEIESKYSANFGSPVHRGDFVLDCGANVGTFTRYALDEGARLVVAIEPAPENLVCLRRNLQREIAESRVIVCPVGVWDKDDVLTLYEHNGVSAMDSFVRPEDARRGPQVALTTIDKLAGELNLSRVDFIKMDIEGAESRALRGAASTLARFHPRLELEASASRADFLAIARQAWPGYRAQCLVCIANSAKRRLEPSLVFLW